jgi:hypothetical protein
MRGAQTGAATGIIMAQSTLGLAVPFEPAGIEPVAQDRVDGALLCK